MGNIIRRGVKRRLKLEKASRGKDGIAKALFKEVRRVERIRNENPSLFSDNFIRRMYSNYESALEEHDVLTGYKTFRKLSFYITDNTIRKLYTRDKEKYAILKSSMDKVTSSGAVNSELTELANKYFTLLDRLFDGLISIEEYYVMVMDDKINTDYTTLLCQLISSNSALIEKQGE